MADKKLLKLLNKALAMEYQAIIQYQTHAVLIDGLESEPVVARLKELASDEEKHADMLRERIAALGGTPETKPEKVTLSDKTNPVLKINLGAEREAIAIYKKIHPMCKGNPKLEHEIRHILMDEMEHVEEISQLLAIAVKY